MRYLSYKNSDLTIMKNLIHHISKLIFILSLPQIVLGERGLSADGHYPLFLANSLRENIDNIWHFIPSPAPLYFPETFLFLVIQSLINTRDILLQTSIINILFCFTFLWMCLKTIPQIGSQMNLFKTDSIRDYYYQSFVLCLFALINFTSTGRYALFWVDGANTHLGAVIISVLVLVLLFSKINKIQYSLLLLICGLGFLSNQLLIVSVTLPILFTLIFQHYQHNGVIVMSQLFRENLSKFLILFTFTLISFIPYYFFADSEISKRHLLSVNNINEYFINMEGLLIGAFKSNAISSSVFTFLILIIIFISIKNYKNKYFQIVYLSILITFVVSMFTGSFRGWNLRLFLPGLTLGILAFRYLNLDFFKKICFGMIAVSSYTFTQISYDFNFEPTREELLAKCINNNITNRADFIGLAGHWDVAPVNYHLKNDILKKSIIYDNGVMTYNWMINSLKNRIDKPIKFIIENRQNSSYGFIESNIIKLPGHIKIVHCQKSDSKIHFFNSDILMRYTRESIK